MKKVLTILFAFLASLACIRLAVGYSWLPAEISFSVFSLVNQGWAKQSAIDDLFKLNLARLNALGAYPRTALIREYVLNNVVGRQYASDLPLGKGLAAVTVFYDRKLLAQGWRMIEEHAAVSCYAKGKQVVCILRAGPQDPGPPPGALLRKSAAPPASAKLFFTIEAGPWP
jgi:hypothetical protein